MKKLLCVVLAALLAFSLAACSNNGNGGSTASEYVGDTNVKVNKAIQDDGVKRLGVAYSALEFSASQMLVEAFKANYKNFGFDEVIVLSADGNLEKQINQIQDLVNQKCDIIVVNSVDSAGVAPVCEQAMEQGVAIMAVDRKIGAPIYYTLETDNVSAGRDVAMTTADRLYYPGIKDGEAHVMYVIGDMSSSAQYDRLEGLKQTLSYYPWIKVVATPSAKDTTEIYDSVIDAFTADPTIKAVYVTGGDDGVTPVVSALRELGKLLPADDPDHVLVGSVDGCDFAIEAIRKDESFCTANQRFDLFCWQTLEVAQDYMNGKYVSKNNNNVQLSCAMILKENIDHLDSLGLLWSLHDSFTYKK